MEQGQKEFLEKIISAQKNASDMIIEYWKLYSGVNTWQFWLMLFMLLVPLIFLYLYIDRTKMLWLGFYGFNIHAWFGYIDAFGVLHGYWEYPYKILPFLPINFSLDTSLVPVSFMFVYQWTLNHNKNFYVYSILTALFYALIFKPLIVSAALFKLNGVNYLHLLLGYLTVVLISKGITSLFLHMQKQPMKG